MTRRLASESLANTIVKILPALIAYGFDAKIVDDEGRELGPDEDEAADIRRQIELLELQLEGATSGGRR